MADTPRPVISPADFVALLIAAEKIDPYEFLNQNGIPTELIETLVYGNQQAMIDMGDAGEDLAECFFSIVATTFVIGWHCGVQFGSRPTIMPNITEDK